MTKPQIQISIVTAFDTTSWQFGRGILTNICATDLRLVPEFVGNSEPLKCSFTDIASVEPIWAPIATIDGPQGRVWVPWDCLWKRTKSVKNRGIMIHTKTDVSGKLRPGWLKIAADADKKINWFDLFKRLCQVARPSFATLHLFTDRETRPGAFGVSEQEEVAADDFLTGAPAATLEKRGIPNLAWATYFGTSYATDMDASVLNSHGYYIEQIAEGNVLTLTDNIFDVQTGFDEFSVRRRGAKEHFRSGMFQLSCEPQ